MYFSPFIISTQFICCGSLLLLFSNNLSASFLSSPCYFCPSPSIFFLVFPFCPHFSRPLISLCLHICVLFLFFTFVLLPFSTLSDSLSNPVSLFLFSLSPSHQSLQKLLLEMGIGQEASEGERERERRGTQGREFVTANWEHQRPYERCENTQVYMIWSRHASFLCVSSIRYSSWKFCLSCLHYHVTFMFYLPLLHLGLWKDPHTLSASFLFCSLVFHLQLWWMLFVWEQQEGWKLIVLLRCWVGEQAVGSWDVHVLCLMLN